MRVAALLLLGGCNALLGLDPAQTGGVDAAGVADAASADHDEDGDGVADRDDVCPHLFDDQADLLEVQAGVDADGVGDACDPRPATGGDRILVFDGFGGELDDRWEATGAIVVDDRALLADADQTGASLLWIEPAIGGETVVLQAGIEVIAWLGAGPDVVTLASRITGGGKQGYACDVVDHPLEPGPAVLALQRTEDGIQSTLVSSPLEANAPLGARTLQLIEQPDAVGLGVFCYDRTDAQTGFGTTDPAPLGQGVLGVRATGVEVAVDWIVAIASPST